MAGLVLPKHVYDARQAAQAKANKKTEAGPGPSVPIINEAGVEVYDIDTPIPIGVPVPHRWLVALMPVAIRSKIGSIHIPDSAVDAQLWINGLGKVCAVGPGVYKGRRYEEMGLSPEDAPKVGDIVIYNAKSPNRIRIGERTLIYVNDDGITASVDPALAHLVKF